ncbi:MAG: hypothetical protein AAHH96_01640 [Candidatus Symbiodolus clandestinus]
MRKIVTMAGSQAGYTTLLHPNKIIGHQENWSIDIEDTVEIGHVASLTIINEKDVMDAANFLRRTEISEHTKYNRMDTDLQISNSKKIFFEKDVGFYLTQYQLKSIIYPISKQSHHFSNRRRLGRNIERLFCTKLNQLRRNKS